MDTTKPKIKVICPDCERAMKWYGIEGENAVPVWRCVCGHSEAAVDPRHVPPVANVEQGPI